MSFVVTLVGVGAGCGATEAPYPLRAGDASTSAQLACARSAQAVCERARECAPYRFADDFADLPTCETRLTAACVQRYEGGGAAPEISDCVAAVRSATCDDVVPAFPLGADNDGLLASCPVSPGLFPKGQLCLRDGDCATGRCSWRGPNTEPLTCGTCVDAAVTKLRALGEACDSPDQCLSQWCSLVPGGRCVKLAKLGESCAGTWCDPRDGLWCTDQFRCVPLEQIPVGGECTDGWPFGAPRVCQVGSSCELKSFDDQKGTCQPKGTGTLAPSGGPTTCPPATLR